MSTAKEQAPSAAPDSERGSPSPRGRELEVPDPRLIFTPAVQALFHVALRGKLSAAAREALRSEGLDLDLDLAPAYPITTWVRCLDIVLRDVWPGVERDEAWRQLGHLLIQGLGETMLGRVMMATIRMLGPKRGLPQIHRGFRNSDNYLQVRAEVLSDGVCEVWFNDTVDRPAYYRGLLEALLEVMRAREPKVTVLHSDGRACTFRVEWAP